MIYLITIYGTYCKCMAMAVITIQVFWIKLCIIFLEYLYFDLNRNGLKNTPEKFVTQTKAKAAWHKCVKSYPNNTQN